MPYNLLIMLPISISIDVFKKDFERVLKVYIEEEKMPMSVFAERYRIKIKGKDNLKVVVHLNKNYLLFTRNLIRKYFF